ncbi:hypothetical protein GGR09_000608 [Bartonella heixiaziensis]
MVYNYKDTQRITCEGCDRHGLICCPAHDDQHPRLSLAKGREGCFLLHCDVGFSFLGIISILKVLGLIESRMHPAENMRFLEIKMTIKIAFFQRKILSFFYMLRKKRHSKRKKFASKFKKSKNTLA